jgi:GTP-binding protein HflX
MRAVDEVLEEIGAGATARLLVFNKIDLLDEDARRDLLVGRRNVVGVSAATGEGLDGLLEEIAAAFEETLQPMELLFPYDDGASLSELHSIAGRIERRDSPEGVRVKARVPRALSHRFADYAVSGAGR